MLTYRDPAGLWTINHVTGERRLIELAATPVARTCCAKDAAVIGARW